MMTLHFLGNSRIRDNKAGLVVDLPLLGWAPDSSQHRAGRVPFCGDTELI